jgi:hypothetical protein
MIDVLRDGSGCAGISDINAGKPAGGFDNIFIYFKELLTINMLSKAPK